MTDVFSQPDDFGELKSSELHSSVGESLGATAGQAFMSGVRGLGRQFQYASAEGIAAMTSDAATLNPSTQEWLEKQRAAIPEVPMADAQAHVKQEGLEGHFKLPDQPTIKKPVLDLMVQHAHERQQYDAAVSRGPQNFGMSALSFVTEMGVGIIDPVNIAAFSIPVVGEARYGMMMKSAGESLLKRAGVRAGVGAAQGTVGGAALVPGDWWLHTQDGVDYTMADALHSVVMSAGMGGAFHALPGLYGDVRARYAGRPLHPAEILADLPPRAQEDVVRAATADVINGNAVRVGEMLNESAKEDPRIAESLDGRPGPVEAVEPEGPMSGHEAVFAEAHGAMTKAGVPDADVHASVVAARYTTRAARLGKSAIEMYRGEGLEVRRGDVGSIAGRSFDQELGARNSVEAFHGSDRKFDKPSIKFGSERGGVPDEKGAVFFSSKKELASSYGKNVISKHIDLSNSEVFDVSQLVRDPDFLRDMRSSVERTATRNDYLKQRAQTEAGKAAIEREWQRTLEKIEHPENDHGFVRYNSAITGAIIERARAKGLDVAVVKNMAEGHGRPSDQFIVLNDSAMLDAGPAVGRSFDQGARPDSIGARHDGTAYELPITNAAGKEVGRVQFDIWDRPGHTSVVKVFGAASAEKGNGYGIAAYQKLADFALSTGRELWSDDSVSPEAARVYRALERRGYKVEEITADRAGYGDPNFKVTAGPARSFNQSMPAFFSAVSRVVDDVKQEKAPAAQWLGMLKNKPGVKPEEMEWLGLENWLKEQKGTVTKTQIQDYIRANNIEVKEVMKGEPSQLADFESRMQEKYGDFWMTNDYLTSEERAERSALASRETGGTTKFNRPDLVLPGGENYRELLLTLPPKDNITREPSTAPQGWGNTAGGTEGFIERGNTGADYRSSHWEEPNVLAHIRFNDRVIEGKRTLFIEEVQSDWAQSYRRRANEVSQAVDKDFDAIADRMVKAGVLIKECD